jgi:hypothetical protein
MALARQGASHQEVADGVGMAIATLMKTWKRMDPDWWAQYEEVRRGLTGKLKPDAEDYDGSFISFRKVYLGMDTTWFQAKAIDAIEHTEPGEVTMILWPPEHGKTTLLEDYCLWKICSNNNYRVTVASETEKHGIKMIERTKNRMQVDGSTPKIHRDFGPLAPDRDNPNVVWTARHINVVGKRLSDERDYNMAAIGLTGRIQGTRCDLLLLDDLQDLKSIELSEKYYDLVVQSFLSRPSMFGRTVIIGTRVGEFDVYRKMREAGIIDHLVTIPAYDVGESPMWPKPTVKPDRRDPETWAPEGVQFLWPEKYDMVDPDKGLIQSGFHRYAYAALRYRVGEPTWWRIYMQRPEAATSMTFDQATTDAMADEYRSIRGEVSPREDGAPVQVIIGVDPAIGGGNGVLAAACYPNRMEVLNARLDYNLTKYEEIIGIIAEECHRFSTPTSVVSMVVIEDKAFQRGILRMDALIELQRRFGFRLVPNNTNSDKQDPDVGVPAMPLSMLRGEITIPWADDVSQDAMAPLLAQLHMWRPGARGNTTTVKKDKVPQDLTMALWFVWRRWRNVGRDTVVHATVNPDQFLFRGSPLRRTTRRRVTSVTQYRSGRGGQRRW